ncbi:hypothetical protein MMC27_007466 [Xylographa pallens]|nr:hypothetical protein [Xylographa pallens]
MCRWFAYVSANEECLLEDVLITPAHSLAKQVHEHYLPKLLAHDPNEITTEHEVTARNRLFNVDGFGVAWYTPAREDFGQCAGPRPALYKCAQPPLHDTNFRSLCGNTATKACFAHIRAATATPIVSVNNHPFVFGRHTFMHNGVVESFIEISRDMCKLMDNDSYANITGSTDSEHFAALYITYLTEGKGKSSWEQQYSVMKMRDAMKKAVKTVVELQKSKLGDKCEANSLNIATTDGCVLFAMRFRNHAREQPPSLYFSTTAGVTMNSKYPDHPDGKENPRAYMKPEEHGSHVIVASEPSTYKPKEWNLIEKNHCIMVETDGTVKVEEITYPAELNSVARGGL